MSKQSRYFHVFLKNKKEQSLIRSNYLQKTTVFFADRYPLGVVRSDFGQLIFFSRFLPFDRQSRWNQEGQGGDLTSLVCDPGVPTDHRSFRTGPKEILEERSL